MPIHFRENQYRGVNAHLQSSFQTVDGEWVSFHNRHIIYICDALNAVLPDGYFAVNETSLQVLETDSRDEGYSHARRTYPDVSIYDEVKTAKLGSTMLQGVTAPSLTIPAVESLSVAEPVLDSVIISKLHAGALVPITRLELLSPTNKPNLSGYEAYTFNRNRTMTSGINLVEIDYMHETHPIIPALPSYRAHDRQAHPFYIAVTIAYPTVAEGITQIYGVGVDEPLPTVPIPLNHDQFVVLNLEAVYTITFSSNPYYGKVLVDYEQPPIHFHKYTPSDQAKIQAVMQRAAEKAAALPPVPDVE